MRPVLGGPTVIVVGDVGLDVVVRPERTVAVGSDTRSSVRVMEGGAGANTAEWLVACGARAVLVGRIGADAAGRQVRDQLVHAGVACALAMDPDAPTCCVVVIIDAEGRRTMLPDRGASARLQPEDLDAALLPDAAHLHLSGYVLLDPGSRPAGRAVLAAARAAGLSTSVDPQAAALLVDVDAFLDDVHGIDLLLPNADELQALTGSVNPADATVLLDHVGAVATTAGAHGAAWVDRAGVLTTPAVSAPYVDPTGCGDAFNAGLLSAWLAGAGPGAALRAGITAGAAAVSQHGARPGPP